MEALKIAAEQNGTEEHYLWPRTAIGNLQAEAWQRVGVSDWLADDPRSRPSQIILALREMVRNRLIPESFSVIDICCGDALVLWQIKRAFPFSDCYGADINAGSLDTHSMVSGSGVHLYRTTIQRLFKPLGTTWNKRPDDWIQFDIAIMLNTYRGWQSADLKDDEAWLPRAADDWFKYRAKFTILTIDDGQRQKLKDNGFWVADIGHGEDNSKMVLLFPCGTGDVENLWSKARR